MRQDFSFGKAKRVLKREDFARIKSKGSRKTSRNFILLQLANKIGEKRLGIIVTKKVGKSTIRSKWKRCLREFFRLNQELFQKSTDNVFIVKSGSKFRRGSRSLQEELRTLVSR